MNRRAPVRSVLAERRMFSNGGMLPISTPFQNTPSGILASSSPLIDSVSQEILAPLTGGPMPMNEGGVAKFQDGGTQRQGSPTRIGGMSLGDIKGTVSEWLQKLTDSGETSDVTSESVEVQQIEPVPTSVDSLGPLTTKDKQIFNLDLQNAMKLRARTLQEIKPHGLWELARGAGFEGSLRTGQEVAAAQKEREAKQPEIDMLTNLPLSHWLDATGAGDLTKKYFSLNPDSVPTVFRYPGYDLTKEETAEEVISEEDSALPFEGIPGAVEPSVTVTEKPSDAVTVEPADAVEPVVEKVVPAEGLEGTDIEKFFQEGLDKDFIGAIPKVDKKQDSSIFLTEWLAANPDNTEAPAETVNNSVDSIFKDALETLEGKKFDVNAFKSEIEALLPKAEKDPEMEGLLIAMMGATILGEKDPNAWVNLGAGIGKGMPAIINFKNKQKEDQRARDMTIAKLAIETKLSSEKDTRTAIRGIEAEKRGVSVRQFEADESARRAVEKEQRQTANYMVVKGITLPGTTFDSDAAEDSLVNIPFNTKMNLTASDAARLKGLGIPLFEVGKPTISYDDIIAGTTPTIFGSDLDSEDWGRMVDPKRVTLFNFGTDKGVELDYYLPLPFGMKNGVTDSFMAENEWASVYLAYDRYRTKFENIGNKLVKLNELAASGKLTGVGGLKGRIGDTMRGLGSVPFAGEIADSLLGGEALSAGSEFDVHARLVLAEIAPWILGESGKTISDTDRVRVARALGYEAKLEDGVMMIEGFNSQLLKNPNQVQMALNEVAGVVNKYIDMGDSQMAGAMVRFGRLSPDQSKTLLENLGKPADIEKKVGKRQASTPVTPLGGSGYKVIDLDLTAGGN